MKPLHIKIFLPAMLSCLLYSAGTVAQAVYPKALTLTQTEQRAVDLKQGMTLEEVEKLLGKPKRTALRAQVGLHEPQGSLQWTYTWSSPSQSDRSLQVVFARCKDLSARDAVVPAVQRGGCRPSCVP